MTHLRSNLLLRVLLSAVLPLLLPSLAQPAVNPRNRVLWYDESARDWQKHALPLGSGNLGCMVFGGMENEHIQLNQDTLWIGSEKSAGVYQAFGDIYITFGQANGKDYRRELDISRAVHTVAYMSDGTNYTREYFASAPAQVMVFRFTADRKKAYSGTVTLTDAHDARIVAESNRLTASGNTEKHEHYKGTWEDSVVLNYESQLRVLHDGGTIHPDGNTISFVDCDALTILVVAATDSY